MGTIVAGSADVGTGVLLGGTAVSLGTGVKDHIDHIWGMNETMLPYLKARWER